MSEEKESFNHAEAWESLMEDYSVRATSWPEGVFAELNDNNEIEVHRVDGQVDMYKCGTLVQFKELYKDCAEWELFYVEETEEEPEGVMSVEEAIEFMGEPPSGRGRRSDEDVEKIRELYAMGYTYKQLMPKFKVTSNTLAKIVKKRGVYSETPALH